MIVTDGFNVYSAEVEQALATDPTVGEVVVIGVPDPKWGEAVKAIVTPAPGHTVDPDAMITASKRLVGSVKAPQTVEVVDRVAAQPVRQDPQEADSRALLDRTGRLHLMTNSHPVASPSNKTEQSERSRAALIAAAAEPFSQRG